MPNYYEILKIAPTSTEAEIRQAYDDLNAQWRRLVSHHDPQTVNQANQALQQLEQIQATLLNPLLRKGYDAGIGIGGAMGGLADPSAILQSFAAAPPVPAPPRSKAPEAHPATATAASLWTCSKCGTANPEHTKFCLKCANQLVRQCPACKNESSLVSTGICGVCGSNYDATLREQERKQALQDAYEQQRRELDEQVKKIDEELANINNKLRATQIDAGITGLSEEMKGAFFWGMMGIILSIFGGIISGFVGSTIVLIGLLLSFGLTLRAVFMEKPVSETIQPQIEALTSRKQALQSERAMLLAELEQARPKRTL